MNSDCECIFEYNDDHYPLCVWQCPKCEAIENNQTQTKTTLAMKNIKVKFTVSTNYNFYYATSLKAAHSFCNKNNLVVLNYWFHYPTLTEKKSAVKCGRGVWVIIINN